MEFKVISEKHNPLLKRKEIVIGINYDGATPSKASLQQALAKDFNTQPSHVEITQILSEIGIDKGTVSIKVWEAKEVPIYGAKKEEAPAAEAK